MNDIVVSTLTKLREERPLAGEFLELFGIYCDAIDNIVDEPKDPELVKRSTVAANAMYGCAYYRKWGHVLTLLERVIINSYFDSVKWESADEQWKREVAKVHSHDAMMMTFAVILIEYGDDALSRVSLAFREQAYEMHKEDVI